MRLPRYWPNQMRSCASMMPRRGPELLVGVSKSVTSLVFASMRPMVSRPMSVNHALFFESEITS